MKEDSPDLLEMLRRHEMAIMGLYESFAAKFSKYHDLWQGLMKDEQRHALWIEKLRSYPAIGSWLIQNVKVKPQAIKSSIEYVESQARTAREGDMKLMQALAIARDLENALIEKQFSRLNNSSSKEINSIMTALAAETGKHRDKLAEAIDLEKRLGE